MVVGSRDLDRIADDIDKERVITSSVYCGRCGYNLRTLPFLYQCPECGNEYNARPLKMIGIFNPYAATFPTRDVLITLACAFVAVLFGVSAALAGNAKGLAIAAVFAACAIINGRSTWREIRRCLLAISIIRRIQSGEDDQ